MKYEDRIKDIPINAGELCKQCIIMYLLKVDSEGKLTDPEIRAFYSRLIHSFDEIDRSEVVDNMSNIRLPIAFCQTVRHVENLTEDHRVEISTLLRQRAQNDTPQDPCTLKDWLNTLANEIEYGQLEFNTPEKISISERGNDMEV